MFFLLAQRLKRVSEERAELKGEMKAAQEIQQLLVPASLDIEPWLKIAVAYIPAKEVGGDFYYCRRTLGGQLVVIGDVSGKGLKAAMLVAEVVGMIQGAGETMNDPLLLLNMLNWRLCNQASGGFITCMVLHAQQDGSVTIANAGHLNPYSNGEEIPLAAGLPLGLSFEAEYESQIIHLAEGQSITLLSDGVLEAQTPSGELYGFERTSAISRQSPAEIARAAQDFGQEDDITALTLTRIAGA
jgi:serine phosphatase RsbU (regulator of sigma subunit)